MNTLQIMKKACCFIFLVIYVTSCQRNNTDVYYDLSFAEISATAQMKHKAFCIVLAREACPPCESYLNRISDDKRHLTKKSVFNIVNTDLPEHHRYKYWIGLSASPVTCVFTPSGKLIAIVKGANENSFDCIERSIEGNAGCAAYSYDPPFVRAGYKDVIQTLNEVLACGNRLDEGENIDGKIGLTVAAMPYPYNIYLQMVNAQRQGNPKEAARYAEQMLLCMKNNKQYRRLYAGLLAEAKYIIDPGYDPSVEAVLLTDAVIRLDDCLKGVPKPFSVTVSNGGMSNLTIDEILTSCDCITLKGDKRMQLKPGESKSLEFVFREDKKGRVKRSIAIFSDAAYNPVEHIEINAIVN